MNKIAGTIVYKGFLDEKKLDELEYSCFDTPLETGNTTLLVFWETKSDIKKIKKQLEEVGEIINYDVSHSDEDRLMLLNKKVEWEVHEAVTFEWIEAAYEAIIDRFAENYEVVAIREAEDSVKFWNKTVKVDFIY